MFNAEKATHLAGSILLQAGGCLSVIKLMKLMYICDRESIKQYAHPITFDKCVSMEHGPVLSTVYNMMNGAADRNKYQPIWDASVTGRDNYSISVKDGFISKLDDIEKSIVDKVLSKFKNYDQWQLVDYTHKYFKEWKDPHGTSKAIEIADIFCAVGYGKQESEMLAENMNHTEATYSYNFDLKRMKEAVEAPAITLPHGLKGKSLRTFILEQARAVQ